MMCNWRWSYTVMIIVVLMASSAKADAITTTLAKGYVDKPSVPNISYESTYFMPGESFAINCTTTYTSTPISLEWIPPENVSKDSYTELTNADHGINNGDTLYRIFIVTNATVQHNGKYTCVSKNGNGIERETIEKEYRGECVINLKKKTTKDFIETRQKVYTLAIEMAGSYPPPTYVFQRNGQLLSNSSKYYIHTSHRSGDALLEMNQTNVYDTANYTIIATNRCNMSRNVSLSIRFFAPPIVNFITDTKKVQQNNYITLRCDVVGYPIPSIVWIFNNDFKNPMHSPNITGETLFEKTAYLEKFIQRSGNVTCLASNKNGNANKTTEILVYDIENGFGVENDFANKSSLRFPENKNVTIKCLASLYDFDNVTWQHSDGKQLDNKMLQYSTTPFSHVAKLKILDISLHHAGSYTCIGLRANSTSETATVNIEVSARHAPIITEMAQKDYYISRFESIILSCLTHGVPRPQIEWFKDGMILSNGSYSNTYIYINVKDFSNMNSTVVIKEAQDDNFGKYVCRATNDDGVQEKVFDLILKDDTLKYVIALCVIFFLLFLLTIYLIWRIKKINQLKRNLKAAGLSDFFKKGGAINPDILVDEQADQLPYDEKFEFPPEKLVLGNQLGAGAFGIVYKAMARGIIDAEETTTVAVKMVKKTADNMYVKALASELKIMVHLGKHVNIVNLLGACTKNVEKRELIVIVEYCKFGNIHNYMQRHREVFIDQLTDNSEKSLGKVNKGFSYSGGSGMQSDYFGSKNTQDTDHTFISSENSNRSERKAKQNQETECIEVSEGYVQPEWRSNYEADYSYAGQAPRPLTSRDLLAWAFQIARGMEYLASRKVMHGDLAARNVLLADDNVVKICDFGLARSVYKNEEYQKKENSPLPVKWLAIECMTDAIFSTQSDVWSFGIVLWELFSLAKTPYPNVSPRDLLLWLTDGHRLQKPPYADQRLYDVMMRCWEQKPTLRPSFTQLQELLGSFLEDNVRDHYVALNTSYAGMNEKNEGEDYLLMMGSPDYNNLVTPSPHHYVNDSRSFFPPTPSGQSLKHDEDGYLQMSPARNQSIFSPRSQTTKFDFESLRLHSRPSEASNNGSELTPMLTLNNLSSRSGSDSDHEINDPPSNHSPYLNMGKIEEESDEVFKPEDNNCKNLQNSVTNRAYISLDLNLDKKPKDIINNYINIPNGLVN